MTLRAVKDENWDQTVPFEPVARDGRLYGRGSSDAKGQVLAHLWGLRAHLAAIGRACPAVNLKFLVEGEEEAGSPGLARLLQDHPDELAADVVIFSDTLLWRADQPGLCTGVRGMLSAHLEIHGPLTDIHSGAVSGVAPNPALELARIIAQLYDQDGRITLPGFYDRVHEIPDARRAELAALPSTRGTGWPGPTRAASAGRPATPCWSGCGNALPRRSSPWPPGTPRGFRGL